MIMLLFCVALSFPAAKAGKGFPFLPEILPAKREVAARECFGPLILFCSSWPWALAEI